VSERPILMSAPMIKAILAGEKTTTRRVVKLPTPRGERNRLEADDWEVTPTGDGRLHVTLAHGDTPWDTRSGISRGMQDHVLRAPYDVETLWVRETWSPDHRHVYPCPSVVYRADGYVDEPIECRCSFDERRRGQTSAECLKCAGFKWRPSIFMPRNKSRLTLRVTGVRVERLHAITDEEALREGVRPLWLQEGEAGCWYTGDPSKGAAMHARTPRAAFEKLWVAINGRASWDENGFVWCVDFEKDK
jgi:hypothetical protein